MNSNNKKLTYICDTNIYKDLLHLPVEVCGNFITPISTNIGLCLLSNDYIYGSIEKQRGSCQHNYYSKIIWHTHPNTSKGYPSREDIWKIIKHKSIHVSIIFTSWGIWELSSTLKYDIPTPIVENNKCLQNCNDYYFMENIERSLYNHTNKGIDYSENAVNAYIKYIQKYKGLSVRFTRWDLIYNNTYVVKSLKN